VTLVMCAWVWLTKLEAYRITDCAYLFDEAVVMASLENRKVTRWSLPSAASKSSKSERANSHA
jgi:hypothetical protein